MKNLINLTVLLSVIFLSGCVVGTRTVSLSIPEFPDNKVGKGEIFISSIEDNRVFESKPAQPNIPSVKGNLDSMSKDERSRMIGRQRNGYGMAMGDIALPADDSVIKQTKVLLEEALNSRGYAIAKNSDASKSASVSIDEFWAWFSPGMFTVSFEARVYCTMKFTKSDDSSTIVVKGYGINKGQIASNANWQLAYKRAFNDFLLKLDAELDKAGY